MSIHALERRYAECLRESGLLINRLRFTHEATLRSVEASRRLIVDSRETLRRFQRAVPPAPPAR